MIFTDQLNNKLEFLQTPKRIISLVPSQTEMLYDFGLCEEIVGITKFCIHPNLWYATKARVGSTKNIDFQKIKLLNPDLIIANKEENDKHQIEELCKLYKVWISDISNLTDAYTMIVALGTLLGRSQSAINLKLQIEYYFNKLSHDLLPLSNNKVAYFIWKNPYMVAGHTTFINDMLLRCGLVNVFASAHLPRYSELSKEQLVTANPDIIFLSSEPFPFMAKHLDEFSSLLPHAKIKIVEGELFSWYGSRLLKSPEYFSKLIQSLM